MGGFFAAFGRGCVAVQQHHVDAALRRHLRNTAAHHARAHNAQGAAVQRRDTGRAVQAFFGLGFAHKQGADHAARDRVAGQVGQVLALHAQGFVHGQLRALVQAALDGQRGRQVVKGLGLQHGVTHHKARRHFGIKRAAAGQGVAFDVPGLDGRGLVQQPAAGCVQQGIGAGNRLHDAFFEALGGVKVLAL